jgi:hypothetical protein
LSRVDGLYSTAVGAGTHLVDSPATAKGDYSTALGGSDGGPYGAQASGFISTAVGAGSQASSGGSSAFGQRSKATANDSSALGDASTASGVSGVAMAVFSTAGGNNSTAAGAHASATAGSSSAYGQTSRAWGVGSAAIGYASKSTGSNSAALGRSSSAGGANNNGGTIAIGYDAQAGTGAAGQTNATAIGTSAKANAADSAAFGFASSASGDSSLALGSGAQATALNAVAIGSGSVGDNANAVSVGASGAERRIVHVANAVRPTDAVNLQQLETLIAAAHAPNLAPMAGTTTPKHKQPTLDNRASTATDTRRQDASANSSRRDGRAASLGELQQVATGARPTSSFACEFGAGRVTTVADEQSSGSSAFALVQRSRISFQQGGSANGCVTLSFSAEVLAPGSSLMEVRAVLDGSVEAAPGPVRMAEGDDAFRSRALNFLFANIAPGAHRVELQFRNARESGFVRIGQRTTIVRFAR